MTDDCPSSPPAAAAPARYPHRGTRPVQHPSSSPPSPHRRLRRASRSPSAGGRGTRSRAGGGSRDDTGSPTGGQACPEARTRPGGQDEGEGGAEGGDGLSRAGRRLPGNHHPHRPHLPAEDRDLPQRCRPSRLGTPPCSDEPRADCRRASTTRRHPWHRPQTPLSSPLPTAPAGAAPAPARARSVRGGAGSLGRVWPRWISVEQWGGPLKAATRRCAVDFVQP